jgi:hypothetical protein
VTIRLDDTTAIVVVAVVVLNARVTTLAVVGVVTIVRVVDVNAVATMPRLTDDGVFVDARRTDVVVANRRCRIVEYVGRTPGTLAYATLVDPHVELPAGRVLTSALTVLTRHVLTTHVFEVHEFARRAILHRVQVEPYVGVNVSGRNEIG